MTDEPEVTEAQLQQLMAEIPLQRAPAHLRRRLQLEERPADMRPMNIVVQTFDSTASLLVDRIGDVVNVNSDAFERPPETLKGPARSVIRGAYKLPDQLLLLLDTDKVLELPVDSPVPENGN